MGKVKVLFVCLGNICRSPAAEGAFRKVVEDAGLAHQFEIDSCGTGSWHVGELPHPTTRKVAKEFGIHLIHRARKFRGNIDVEEYDFILPMDHSNYQDVVASVTKPESKDKIYLFRDFDVLSQDNSTDGTDRDSSSGQERNEFSFQNINSYGRGQAVPDPYYGGLDGFIQVQKIVMKASHGLLEYIEKTMLQDSN